MSNSTTNLDLISSTQANKEAVANAMFDAASPSMLWGRRASTCTGLTWGYYGGNYQTSSGSNTIANGTVALTASATNSVYASATTGAVSVSTSGFPAGAIPLYVIVTGTLTVTSYTDVRSYAPGAIAGGGGSFVPGVPLMGGAVKTAAYTMLTTDRATCLVMNSASAVTETLPTPTGSSGNFPSGWFGYMENIGAGLLTVAVPTGETLDGVTNGTLPLSQNTGIVFFTDGSNWYTVRGAATGGGGGSTTLAGLSDVSVTEGSGIDMEVLRWNNALGKWVATAIAMAETGSTTTFNPSASTANFTLSNGNLTGTTTSTSWQVGRTIASHTTGKWYAECKFVTIGTVANDKSEFGICNGAASISVGSPPGIDANGYVVFSHGDGTGGTFYNSNTPLTSGFNLVNGTVIGVAVDIGAKKLWFYNPITGLWNNDVIANQNPATGAGGSDITALLAANGTVYLAGAAIFSATSPVITLNAGSSAFSNPVPSGFTAWAALVPSLIQDVAVVAPVSGQQLYYNGTAWVNGSPPAPAFSAYQSAAQTLPSATATKISLQSKEFDTQNAFDSTTNYRFQPQVAGYYQISGTFFIATTQTALIASIYKNGALLKSGVNSGSACSSSTVSSVVFLNGSTDYVEFWGFASTGQALVASSSATYFSGSLVSKG